MDEGLPPLEEIDQGRGKSSTHSTVAASTDDEFDVPTLDDDIEVAAEQVVDEWAGRLKGSDVFAEEEPSADEEVRFEVGTMNEALPAGGYDEVVMGYDDGNIEDEHDDENGHEGDEEDEMFEEVVEDVSFSEEIIDDTEMLMDDGEIEEILSQAANIAEEEDADDADDDEIASIHGQIEDRDQEPSEEGSVVSKSSAFEARNELLSAPPAVPYRQISDGEAQVENTNDFNAAEPLAHVEPENTEADEDEELLEQNLEGPVDMSATQGVVGVHETKQYARPDDGAVATTGTDDHDDDEEASTDEIIPTLDQRKDYRNQGSDDIESGMSVAPDIPESVQTDDHKKDGEDVDDDDEDDGFLCCILIVACLCFALVILSIVLPLVFLRKRGDGPTLSPTFTPTQSPVVAPSTQVPEVITSSPTSILMAWTQNISTIKGTEESDFGSALALDGSFYVVGAPKHNGTGAIFTAYFDDVWRLAIDPLLVGETENEDFGASLDIFDGQLIVGAPSRLINMTRTPAGVAYVYVFDDATKLWAQVGETLQTEEDLLEANGEFGAAVAIGNNGNVPRVAVGAPKTSQSMDNLETGRVYTYEISPTATVALDEKKPMFGSNPSDLFGYAIDMTSDGQRLIVGAPGVSSSPGYVQIFKWKDSGWDLEIEIPGSSSENLGTSVVCLSNRDDIVAIGAPNYKDSSGRVVVYRRVQSGSYEQLGTDIEGAEGDTLGMKGSVNGGIDENGDVLLIVAASSGDVKTFRHEESTNSWIQHAAVLKTGHEKVLVEYSEEDGLLVADPDEVTATLYGPDGTVVASSLETFTGPVPLLSLELKPSNAPMQRTPSQPSEAFLSNWNLSQKEFSPVRPSSNFATSISMATSLMAIGAPATSESGAVLIYEKVNGKWVGSASAEIEGKVIGGRFGAAVDTTGRFLIVGAPNTILPGTDTEIGAVYCYTASGGEWNQFGETLRGDTGVFGTDEEFGSAVAASNNGRIIVGAPSSSVELLEKRGRFYVFEYSTSESAWTLVLDIEGVAAGDTLGHSVAMSSNGDRFIVGAPGGNYVYSYVYDGVDWTMVSTLEVVADEAFGSSVSFLSNIGDIFAVGSPLYEDSRGRVVVYQETSGSGGFEQLGPAIVGKVGEAIGTTVAGNSLTPTVLVGTRSGLVKKYVYDETMDEWDLESVVDSEYSEGVTALDVSYESNELAAGSSGSLSIFEQQ